MDHNYCINICQQHHHLYVDYKRSQAFTSKAETLAQINLVHATLFGFAENLMCPSCKRNMVTRVFMWYEDQLKQNQNDINNLSREQLVEMAKQKNIPVGKNSSKYELIKRLNGTVRER